MKYQIFSGVTSRGSWVLAYEGPSAEIETLARIAARAAGRDPDEHVRIVLGDMVVFDDVAWRYPDFLDRAAAAHAMLSGATLPASTSSTAER